MALCRQCDICGEVIHFKQGVDKAKYLTITDDDKTYKNLDICENCYGLLCDYIEKLSLTHLRFFDERGESMSGTQEDT
jgi:hypothetical protein